MRTSPGVARWLLQRLGCSPLNENIVGDLDEQFHNGRSRIWYWAQALTAILTSVRREVFVRPWMAVRAMATAWALLGLYAFGFKQMASATLAHFHPDSEQSYAFFIRLLPVNWWRYHLEIDIAVYMILSIVVSCIVGTSVGWVVARFHRPHPKAFVLLYISSAYVFVIAQAFILAFATSNMRTLWMLLCGFIGNLLAVGSGWLGACLAEDHPRGVIDA
jgi:hypothetical protein